MKKVVSILFAACLVFALMSNANAYWEEGNLYQVIFNEVEGIEYGYDLGAISGMGAVKTIADPGVMDGYYTGFFSYIKNTDGSYDYYWATTSPTAPSFSTTKTTTFSSAFNSTVKGAWYSNDSDADGDAQISTSNPSSYWYSFDSHAVHGQYAGFNKDFSDGEDSLSDGFVGKMYLYQFHKVGLGAPVLVTGDTPYRMEISTVPIPGGLLLLASGILGLVGIKRRHSA
ncbi:MAG: VPLPA-CTERM sorting domain-containing protein [bacterium]